MNSNAMNTPSTVILSRNNSFSSSSYISTEESQEIQIFPCTEAEEWLRSSLLPTLSPAEQWIHDASSPTLSDAEKWLCNDTSPSLSPAENSLHHVLPTSCNSVETLQVKMVPNRPPKPLTEMQLLNLSAFFNHVRYIVNDCMKQHSINRPSLLYKKENMPSADINVRLGVFVLVEIIDTLENIKNRSQYTCNEYSEENDSSKDKVSWYQLNNFRPILNSFPFDDFDQHKIPPLCKGKYKVEIDYINSLNCVTLYFPIRKQIPESQISVIFFENGEFKSVTP